MTLVQRKILAPRRRDQYRWMLVLAALCTFAGLSAAVAIMLGRMQGLGL